MGNVTLTATNTNSGTVTQVQGNGTVNGITLTGNVTSSGNITLGGTLGSIANSQLSNSSVTIGNTSVSLGSTVTSFGNITLTNATISSLSTAITTTEGGTGLTSYTAGDLPYYSSGSALSKLGIGTNGYVLESNGSAPTWVAQSTLSVGTATNATNTAITDNTSSSATWYPTIVSATTGNLSQTTSSTKLSFVPSTGVLTATQISASQITSSTGNVIFSTSGTGIQGTTTNDNANSGVVGQYIDSSALNVTVGTSATTVTSISLTAGDWDISGCNYYSGTANNYLIACISTTANSTAGYVYGKTFVAGTIYPTAGVGVATLPRSRVSITSTTTYYLIGFVDLTSSTVNGYISARRMR